jgi:hypothetical protein
MIGKNLGNTSNNYTGYIYEILVYNSLLFSSSRFAIEGYLAWKWGIQQFLPSSHAYSKNRPSAFTLATPWPRVFSDLQPILWLDAQDPNANESFAPEERTFIQTWYDKSGNQNNLTAPTYSEPMYTKNIIKAGGIQFNRYAYKSMSYVPLPIRRTGDTTFPTTGTTAYTPHTAPSNGNQPTELTNVPYNWIPGFGEPGISQVSAIRPFFTTYDSFGFVYFCISNEPQAKLYQYDERNNQTRILFHVNRGDTSVFYIYVNPRNGNIVFTVRSHLDSIFRPLHILIPDSFPTTSTTNYPTVRIPKISWVDPETKYVTHLGGPLPSPAGTGRISGAMASLFVDKNENLYMTYNKNAGIFVFPAETNLNDPTNPNRVSFGLQNLAQKFGVCHRVEEPVGIP